MVGINAQQYLDEVEMYMEVSETEPLKSVKPHFIWCGEQKETERHEDYSFALI
jgi:hypothetical protein